ncbi:MAG: hypothetical protein JW909_11120 [Planctomycetes bacterium]|nr:hypothetical protein [Planctomycetota bacterium]
MFEKYLGRNQSEIYADDVTKTGCRLWLERVLAFYGEDGGVDVEIIDGQLPLTEKTADYIYSAFTPIEPAYRPGSRPMLEKIVAGAVSAGMSEREKALALMRVVRDSRTHGLASPNLFTGGSEEELLKRGAVMGNEVSRVLVVLCQIAGLPARTHSSHISGHMMAEIFTGGKWGWMDPMKGVAPVLPDGSPASAWDLFRSPILFERQPSAVWDDIRPTRIQFSDDGLGPDAKSLVMARNRDCYFHPREAASIGNYFAGDFLNYTYPWRMDAADPVRLEEIRHEEHVNRRKMGLPDYYFNQYLFDEVLQPV